MTNRFSVKLLSSSSLKVLWMCLGKRTRRRSFHGPNPSLFSHQTWHILFGCMRGVSPVGAGHSEACPVLLRGAVPQAQAVTTCCLDGAEWPKMLVFALQGWKSHLWSTLQICTRLFCSPNTCGALLSFITIISSSSTHGTTSIPANYRCSCFPPAGRLIVMTSLLGSLGQLVLQQVTKKTHLKPQKINNSELHVQTSDISSLLGSLHRTLLRFLRAFFKSAG